MLVDDGHVHELLRIELDGTGERGERLLLDAHGLHHAQRRHDAVACGLEVAEDDVAGLLAAQRVAVLAHAGIDVLVAHVGGDGLDAGLVEGLEQAEVGHDGGYHGVLDQAAVLGHVAAAYVEDEVAVDHVAVLVDRDAAVGVAVVGESHVEAVAHDEALEVLDMRRAGVDVDVESVGHVVGHIDIGAQRIEDWLRDAGGGAVGAVEAHLDALQREVGARDEVRDVAVAALHVVDRAADGIAGRERDLDLSVDEVLDLLEHVLVHLVALAVDELDAVVVVGIVARRDHDAAVEGAVDDLVAHAGRGDHVQHVGVRPAGDQTGYQCGLEHVARAARVLAQHDAGLLALAQTVIPAYVPADEEGVLHVEALVGLTAEAIGPEVLHLNLLIRNAKAQNRPMNSVAARCRRSVCHRPVSMPCGRDIGVHYEQRHPRG